MPHRPAVVFSTAGQATALQTYGPTPFQTQVGSIDLVIEEALAAIDRTIVPDAADPTVWMAFAEIWPAGHAPSTSWGDHEAADWAAWEGSLAKAAGVGWEAYRDNVRAVREAQFSANAAEADNANGSYYFSLEPSARVSAPYISALAASSWVPEPLSRLLAQSGGGQSASINLGHLATEEARQWLERAGYRLRFDADGPATNPSTQEGNVIVRQSGKWVLEPKPVAPQLPGAGSLQEVQFWRQESTVADGPTTTRDGVTRAVVQQYSSPEAALADAERVGKSIAASLGRRGAQTGFEYGIILALEGNALVAYGVGGTANSVNVEAPLRRMERNGGQPVWLIHNHPNQSTFSTEDILTGVSWARRFPDTFQGLLLGLPVGDPEVFKTPDLPKDI